MAAATFYHGDNCLMVDYTPESAVIAGDVVVVGDIPMVAHVDIAVGEKGALAAMGGVYTMTAAAQIAAGTWVYFDTSDEEATETAASNPKFGFTVSAAAQAGDSINVAHLPGGDVTT